MHLLAAHVERPREVSVSESESDAPGQHSSFAFVETLRRELATAQDTVNSLISQNTELRTRLVEQGVSTVSSSDKQVCFNCLIFCLHITIEVNNIVCVIYYRVKIRVRQRYFNVIYYLLRTIYA